MIRVVVLENRETDNGLSKAFWSWNTVTILYYGSKESVNGSNARGETGYEGENSLMHRIVSVYGRKVTSVALIFNALLTISCAIGLLWGFYVEHWVLYPPFLPNGNLYWIAIAAALINLFPAAHIGKVHTGRLWFHHYVYGFFVLISSIAWVVFFTSVSLLSLFFINTTNVAVNVGRFFILGGLTLVLDDLPDVHTFTFRGLQWMKVKAHQARKFLTAAQLTLGIATLFLFAAVSLSIATDPQWLTLANCIQMGTLLVTALTCFTSIKRKTWFKLHLKHQPFH
jgi:hypothetical protein